MEGRNLTILNKEYANRPINWGNRQNGKFPNGDDLTKGKGANGITVAEIEEAKGVWSFEGDSPFNRRITPILPFAITGPAREHVLVKTVADPGGILATGTRSNCGSGRAPRGTFLSGEENIDEYFSASGAESEIPLELKRCGAVQSDERYGWSTLDERFDILLHPNEPNRAGYVVEIDPFEPMSTPRILTAIGRFEHENAEVVINGDDRIVVYLGDDERGEFLYRLVSDGRHAAGGNNSDFLDGGTLFAPGFMKAASENSWRLNPK